MKSITLASSLTLLALTIAVPVVVQADESRQFIQVDGLDIYYGISPGPIWDAAATTGDRGHMQRETARRGGSHHLVVALFDTATGQRVQDAAVTARIHETSGRIERKPLHPMTIAATVTYGNFFQMDADMPYRIQLSVQRGDATISTEFPYRHINR